MITIAIFTYKRIARLNQCLQTLDSTNIDEILIFNDDERKNLGLNDLEIKNPSIKIFNPSDWGFTNRKFRKPIYLNRAVEIAKNDKILFSDDDGRFTKGAINLHFETLNDYKFSAGGIIRNRLLNRISKSILQGTNYAFQKSFFTEIGGYDEKYCNSMGGGDIDFWYRIYKFSKTNKVPCAFLPEAIQKVTGKGSRVRMDREFNPKEYTMKKHRLNLSGPMYKWFPEIRNKRRWMTIAS